MLKDYAAFADAMHGKWGTAADGTRKPTLRVLMKPIINLFHGEPGCKRWKRSVDEHIKGSNSISQLLEKTLGALSDRVLDAAPEAGPPADYAISDCPPPFNAACRTLEVDERTPAVRNADGVGIRDQENGSVACENGAVNEFANGLAEVG